MNAAGFLLPPEADNRTPEQAVLWDSTFERIQPFLPDLREDLFPTPVFVRSVEVAKVPVAVAEEVTELPEHAGSELV